MIGSYNSVVVLGATASGKTKLAVQLAAHFNGEIISADSRQVYKHLDIGTGKDLNEYSINNTNIPYHCIDIVEPGEQFFLHQFIAALDAAFLHIQSRSRLPIIAGGSGLYLDAITKDFSLTAIPENHSLREKLSTKTKPELIEELDTFLIPAIEHIDRNSAKRIIRGIEIAHYLQSHPMPEKQQRPKITPIYIGIKTTAEERAALILARLQQRLNNGLIEEAQTLLKMGISHQRLQMLGLEYKYLSYFLLHQISRAQLETQLSTAILQFSKRQMTWFRKMEKEGCRIFWFSPQNNIQDIFATVAPLLSPKI